MNWNSPQLWKRKCSIQERGLKRVADQSQVHVPESRRVPFSTRVGGLTECASRSIMLMRLTAADLKHKVTFRGCVFQTSLRLLSTLKHGLYAGTWRLAERLAKMCVANDFRSFFFLRLPKVTLSLFFVMNVNILGSRPRSLFSGCCQSFFEGGENLFYLLSICPCKRHERWVWCVFLTRALWVHVQVVSQLTLEHLRCFRISRSSTTVSATCVDQTRPKSCGVRHVFDVIVCLTLCPSGLCSQVRIILVGLHSHPHRQAAFLTGGDFGHLPVCFQELRWCRGDIAHVVPR